MTEEVENTFSVVYTVWQKVTKEKENTFTNSTSRILLYQDKQENIVIIQNPTIWNRPEKSNFSPEHMESDGTVEAIIEEEIIEFLETFFTSYPTASDKELSYYIMNDSLPIIEKKYTFSELINPVFQELHDNKVKVWVTVKYLDETTKATQLSQYELILEKDKNWMIVG